MSRGQGKGTSTWRTWDLCPPFPPHLFSAALSHSSLARDVSASRRWITSSISLSLSFLISSRSSRSRESSQASCNGDSKHGPQILLRAHGWLLWRTALAITSFFT